MTRKRAAVLAEFHVCEPMDTPMPKVWDEWHHPRIPEVHGMVNEVTIEDRLTEVVWTARVVRWILE